LFCGLFHARFYFVDRDGDVLHQVFVAIFSDPEIVFNAHAHFLFLNINSRFNSKYHPGLDGLGAGSKVMHVDTKVVRNTVIEVFTIGAVLFVLVL